MITNIRVDLRFKLQYLLIALTHPDPTNLSLLQHSPPSSGYRILLPAQLNIPKAESPCPASPPGLPSCPPASPPA